MLPLQADEASPRPIPGIDFSKPGPKASPSPYPSSYPSGLPIRKPGRRVGVGATGNNQGYFNGQGKVRLGF